MALTEIKIVDPGRISGKRNGIPFIGQFPLLIIRAAWERGMNAEDLADGFGKGRGTHGDWSGIRDSSDEAVARMLERALAHLMIT